MMMKWTAAVNESEQRLHEILRLRANLNAKNERITELEVRKTLMFDFFLLYVSFSGS